VVKAGVSTVATAAAATAVGAAHRRADLNRFNVSSARRLSRCEATDEEAAFATQDVSTSELWCGHMDFGIRELKQHLSEYLDRVERGEVIRVTDRGRPKAMLSPVPGRGAVDRGVEEGWITPGLGGPLPPVRPATSTRTIADVLAEDRGE
jgi:prevent-host-death family protein